ncbi:dihydrofolate reductase family protein [Lysinibacter cavernae]|uniref:Dihydrofolate reductase n=1 Tax=Lysinibacter cavernae TaxID=1640652 RepID=A0A7X5TUI3_9MICO|nr:dihydrofolate reductase family protein [Lysinibacter cavernae]NIH54413.1 dihydrofolate reductase [Lysinibacter cavernae]
MAARFVYWMNVSLDLKIEYTAQENGGGDWMRINETLHREFNRRAKAFSASVEGSKVYEIMESYWPNVRSDESEPDVMREYGEIWTSSPKYLVSRTRTSADYNTQIIGENAIERLAEIRRDGSGDIGVGGATIATQLLQANLLDELLLFTHPAVLGQGRPLFDEQAAPVQLDLLEQASFSEGVTMHRYSIRHS